MDSGRIIFNGCPPGSSMLFLGNLDPFYQGSRTMIAMDGGMKRPFFTMADDFMDDDLFDEQAPEKKRRLTPEQVHLLEKSFETENKLEPERKSQLAKKLGLQPRQVAVWFQNRRARWKTKQLERNYDLLRSAYDSLTSDYQNLIHEKDKLKSEVVTLLEKLETMEGGGMPKACNTLPETGDVVIHFKAEDRLSSGTGGSGVVDEDGPQLIDSGNSCLPNYVALAAMQSEEDEDERRCSSDEQLCIERVDDDGVSYFQAYCVTEHHHDDEQHGWGVCGSKGLEELSYLML